MAATTTVNNPVSRSADRGKEPDLSDLRNDVSRLTNDASAVARTAVQNGAERASEISADLQQRTMAGRDYLADKVRSHPMSAIAVAAGAGVLLSMLVRRR